MSLIRAALRTPPDMRALRPVDHVWAAAAMGVLPSSIAYAVASTGPACHAKRDPHLFEWGCLFPMTVVMVAVGFVVLSLIAMVAAWRKIGPARIGWLPTVLGGGFVAQVALVSYFFIFLVGDGINPMSTGETLTMPWPFLAGMIAAAVYWATLWLRRRTPRATHDQKDRDA